MDVDRDEPTLSADFDAAEPISRSPEELLALISTGGHAAFVELYRQTAPMVLRVATSLLKDRHQAEEVTQEVFLEIWRTAARFDPAKGSPFTWLRMLTRARSVDRIRQTRAVRLRDHGYADRRGDDRDLVLDQVVLRSDQRRLWAAVGQLSPLRREAIAVTFLQGLTYAEAGIRLGIPVSTMKTRIRDALIALNGLAPSTA